MSVEKSGNTKNSLQLTENQSKALTRDCNVAVTAGAGSGKTRILVARYLDILLKDKLSHRHLLAITFTEKAAKEMMERIREELKKNLDEAVEIYEKNRLQSLYDRIGSAYISTIHSFCMRILREFPVEAGIDPDLIPIEGVQAKLLMSEVLENLFMELDNESAIWLPLFRQFGISAVKNMLKTSLEYRYEIENIMDFFDKMSPEAVKEELISEFLEYCQTLFPEKSVNKAESLMLNIVNDDCTKWEENEIAKQLVEKIKRYVSGNKGDIVDRWRRLYEISDCLTTQNGKPYKSLAQLGGKSVWGAKAQNDLLSLAQLICPLASMELPAPGEKDLLVIKQLPLFYRLFRRFENLYDVQKRKRAQIDFTDMQRYVLDLLRINVSIRSELQDRFKYIFIDEFQDTNMMQWQIISQLGDPASNKFFIVGDVKQSIYGFRNADVRLFKLVKESFSRVDERFSEKGNQVLVESFRFKKDVNRFINHSFSKIFIEDNEWEVGYEPIETFRTDNEGGQVEWALLNEQDQAAFVAQRIAMYKKKNGFAYKDMAVLLRSRTHLREIEQQLRQNNIPFYTSGGFGFYQKQEIIDLYLLSRFLLDPTDDNALIGVLRSPFVNCSDESLLYLGFSKKNESYWHRLHSKHEIKLLPEKDLSRLSLFMDRADRWLARRGRVGFSDLLREICEDSFYRATIAVDTHGEQLVANLDKIIGKTEELESTGFTSLGDFANLMHTFILEEIEEGEAHVMTDSGGAVNIMTIHRAKGLEFPVVFLPFLDQKSKPMSSGDVYFDNKWGTITGVSQPEKDHFLLRLVQKRKRIKELAELKRIFYVGCTRAKDYLILCAGKIVPETPSAWLHETLASDDEKSPASDGNPVVNMIREFQPLHVSRTKSHFDLERLGENLFKQDDRQDVREVKDTIPEGEIYSATQLLTFAENRQNYFKRYHLGFFESDYDAIGEISDAEESPLLRGKLLHRYLELYPNADLDKLFMEYEIFDEATIQESRRLTEIILSSKHIKRFMSATLYKTEISLMMSVSNDILSGTIDRIFVNDDGSWEIVDYKTNRISNKRVAWMSDRYRLQMEIYALLVSRLFPQQDRVTVTLYFIEPDMVFQMVYDRNKLLVIESNVLDLIRQIKKYPVKGMEQFAFNMK